MVATFFSLTCYNTEVTIYTVDIKISIFLCPIK